MPSVRGERPPHSGWFDRHQHAHQELQLSWPYGALAATAIADFRGLPRVDLIVPENGHIALNPPLTPRRIGSYSTRTTHPFFLDAIQRVMETVGLPVVISNPLRHQTKGEMMSRHATATVGFPQRP